MMENKKSPTFFWGIIAVIMGATLFKKFDFQTLRFEKPALGIIYLVVFVCAIYFLIKGNREKAEQ